MLTEQDIRTFIMKSQQTSFNLKQMIDILSGYLESDITLIDNSGFIVYKCQNNSPAKTTIKKLYTTTTVAEDSLDILYSKPLYNITTIWSKGHSLGALIIDKKELEDLEKALVEIAIGIISIRMR